MKIRPQILAVVVLLLVLAFLVLVTQIEAQVEVPDVVKVEWRTDGVRHSESFVTPLTWMSATQGATTTVFWVGPTGKPESFVFVADNGLWSVGETIEGDLNGDGKVNIFDAIQLVQLVVSQ